MNENDFAKKIARTLDAGVNDLGAERLERLRAARARAMDAYRAPVSVLGLVTVTGPSVTAKYDFIQKPLMLLPLIALVAALFTAGQFQDTTNDTSDVDAALLTGELPINAFLDKDFDAWLKSSE